MGLGNLYQDPHRRFNPVTRDWVLVSPHRADRPWRGRVESASSAPALTTIQPAICVPATNGQAERATPNIRTHLSLPTTSPLKPEVQDARRDDSKRGLLLSA